MKKFGWKKNFLFPGSIGAGFAIIYHLLISVFDSVRRSVAEALINFGVKMYILYPSLVVVRLRSLCLNNLQASRCISTGAVKILGTFADIIFWFLIGALIGFVVYIIRKKN